MIIENGMEKVELLGGPLDGLVVLVELEKDYRPEEGLMAKWGMPRMKPVYSKLYDGYYQHSGDDRVSKETSMAEV